MANMINFTMVIKGKRENRDMFLNALKSSGLYWIGRGAYNIEILSETKDYIEIAGEIKNSILDALDTYDIVPSNEDVNVITYRYACKKWNVSIECWSEDDGNEFCEYAICTPTENRLEVYNFKTAQNENGEWEIYESPNEYMEFTLKGE